LWRTRDPAHQRTIIGVAENEVGGDDPVAQDLLLVIEIVEEEV
jgi:hypothetical protein